mmetsp:Transcript_33974/g.67982  ORF Transcript_33974/g.67982 Transcript_33974/m.67982 type:complete len:82 (-) Transcript_33974:8-253(-)
MCVMLPVVFWAGWAIHFGEGLAAGYFATTLGLSSLQCIGWFLLTSLLGLPSLQWLIFLSRQRFKENNSLRAEPETETFKGC